jgi:hypothetical protein
VNGVAAWRGLQSVTRLDLAAALADDLLERKLAAQRRLLTQADASADTAAVATLPARHA